MKKICSPEEIENRCCFEEARPLTQLEIESNGIDEAVFLRERLMDVTGDSLKDGFFVSDVEIRKGSSTLKYELIQMCNGRGTCMFVESLSTLFRDMKDLRRLLILRDIDRDGRVDIVVREKNIRTGGVNYLVLINRNEQEKSKRR